MRKCEEESNHSCVTVFECVVPFVGAADEEVWLTVDAAHGAVASFDETEREAGHVGELMRIRGEGCGCVRGRGAVQHCEAIFHRAEEHRRGRARRCTGAEGKGGGDEWAGGRVRCGWQHYARRRGRDVQHCEPRGCQRHRCPVALLPLAAHLCSAPS
ncbi:hypothetical protein ERJ75_000863800 [Trypanosoma vivax]|nr:hypothetical protein ERJ75_000863800 [Trypanosoma vivax]